MRTVLLPEVAGYAQLGVIVYGVYCGIPVTITIDILKKKKDKETRSKARSAAANAATKASQAGWRKKKRVRN